ncbi:MAG: alanine--tRNA ligase [Clostridiales Family XIII bacterium]|jgi:alanyl-tRNA synthetase|nr:alanine--tRNA ligase [Clostridiales Family XIII bacterium]
MEKLGLNRLRGMFQEFYEGKEHYARKSFSLIPAGDKSLLLINSGMAPLKPYFAGIERPPSKRMTTCQKCIRTGDIDNVGHTARHGTFFEMLGSFSFGDYFKRESLRWGWEFITEILKMPADRLWASVYEEDDEAVDIWTNDIGLDPARVIKLGKEDNFWEIGQGPCGPCSEIYFDRGGAHGCGRPDCGPGCDCDRYVEFWNHVFTQFNRDAQGAYTPLTHRNIDTGMGLERLACIMQDTDSIFNVDTIRYVLQGVCEAGGVSYKGGADETDISVRIVTDHIRSVVFMTGDGILPGNEGRGYVLRRLLRRAARHGRLLGAGGDGFLSNLADRVIETAGDAYPELAEKHAYIKRILRAEEEKFSATIDQGSEILDGHIAALAAASERILSGDKAFKLYDTYGFPLELTQEILAEHGYTLDEAAFAAAMKRQKEAARAARKHSGEGEGWSEEGLAGGRAEPTVFTGYDRLTDRGQARLLLVDKRETELVRAGDAAVVILDRTPFYAEGGGQAGDRGFLRGEGFLAEVCDVTGSQDVFLHHIRVKEGVLRKGDAITAEVDAARRNGTARNHTATHLLQGALRRIVGEHVEQAGSAVGPDGLRFDFTHFEAPGRESLEAVEALVNEKILAFLPVKTEEKSVDEALASGATALFGEKYGNRVRVVAVGDFSTELCGGTHVADSGQIGAFKIVSEGGVAAGVRRIEAITGAGLLAPLRRAEETLDKLAESLKTRPENLAARLASVLEENKNSKRELEALRNAAIDASMEDMLAAAKDIGGVRLVRQSFKDRKAEDLRILSDRMREAAGSLVIVLASEHDGKAIFIVSVSDDLLDKGYHAGKLIKRIAAAAGGGGGGKADMAQAGANEPSRIPEALALAEDLLLSEGGG